MVKNTTGGTGTKSLARKHLLNKGGKELRTPSCELEMIACVTKAFGNGMVEIHTNDTHRLIGHIRNKFRGKQKRHNMISVNSVVLIGLREWENPAKNCDILTIYDANQVEQLKNIPSIDMSHVLKLSLGSVNNARVSTDDINDLVFTEDDPSDPMTISTTARAGGKGGPPEENLFCSDEINIDDI